MKFIIATKNKKKLAELARILAPLGIEAISEAELDAPLEDVEETGETFAENAYLKASAACAQTGLPAIADDSGLCVDALDGAPGVYSARYGGAHGDDDRNIDLLLQNLAGVPEAARTAHFACAVCCVFPDGRRLTVQGECPGKIAFERHGSHGFGYDPVFLTDGGSFAELTDQQKDEISHRGQALRALAKALPEYLK